MRAVTAPKQPTHTVSPPSDQCRICWCVECGGRELRFHVESVVEVQSRVHELDVRGETSEHLIELLVAVVGVVQCQNSLHQLGVGECEYLLWVVGLWQVGYGGVVVLVGGGSGSGGRGGGGVVGLAVSGHVGA